MEEETPTHGSALSTEVTFRPFAFASTTGVFILIGAIASLFGPLLDSFSARFHVSVPTAGFTLSVYFVGATLGVLPGWLGLKRRGGRFVLTVALLAIAIGAGGVTFSHHWGLFLASVFLIGVGFGTLDISLNSLMARTALEGRARRLSLGNAGYGVGAVIGPLLIIAVGPHNFTRLFAGIFVLALVLTTTNRGVHAPPLRAEAQQIEISKMTSQRRPILLAFVVACFLYVAMETSASGWMATQLHRGGDSTSVGSLVTAGFWTGMTIGRALGGPLFRWFGDKRLVLGGLGLAVVVALVALSDTSALVAYPLLGLIFASVFPMALIWYTTLCPHDSDGVSILLLAMLFGGVAGPGATSLLVAHFGVHVVPVTLSVLAAADLVVFVYALRFRPLVIPTAATSTMS